MKTVKHLGVTYPQCSAMGRAIMKGDLAQVNAYLRQEIIQAEVRAIRADRNYACAFISCHAASKGRTWLW